jgi:hypothetical protein
MRAVAKFDLCRQPSGGWLSPVGASRAGNRNYTCRFPAVPCACLQSSNDGTPWSEQLIYFQAAFALDTAQAMAAKDPAIAANPAPRLQPKKTVHTLE